MARIFGALARGLAGYRKGQSTAEQEQYERGIQEDELRQRAAQEFVRNAQWERQHRYQRERDQMVDQRLRDADETERQIREGQRIDNLVNRGAREIPYDKAMLSAAQAAMGMGSTGAAMRGFDAEAVRESGEGMRGADPFKRTTRDGQLYEAAPQGGVQLERVGGKVLALDPQRKANEETQEDYDLAERMAIAREDQQAQQKALQEQRAADQRALRAMIEAGINSRQSTPDQKPRPVPNAVNQAYLQNSRQLNTIEQAIADVRANPSAVGLKNLAPDLIVDRLPGRGNSGGVNARAGVADVGSLEIRDRSGAAVTASEFPRLRPFVPSVNDNAETVIKKLERMREIIAEETEAMREFYSADQGFTGLPPAPASGRQTPRQNPGQGNRPRRPGDIR